jgi:hypothetical protein
MTTLLTQVLLIAFMAYSTAQRCSFCPGKKKPRNPNLVLFQSEGPVTCKDLVIKYSTFNTNCDSIGDPAYKFVCGCPGVKAGPCNGMCDAGEIITNPTSEFFFDDYESTCFIFDQRIKGGLFDTTCPDINPDNQEYCGCKLPPTAAPAVKVIGNMGATGNQGMGNNMLGGRKLKVGRLEEIFPPRAARGLAM